MLVAMLNSLNKDMRTMKTQMITAAALTMLGVVGAARVSGEVVGETTSGTFSPTLQKGIALALLSPEVALGDTLFVDVRGRYLEVVVTKPPFVNSTTK